MLNESRLGVTGLEIREPSGGAYAEALTQAWDSFSPLSSSGGDDYLIIRWQFSFSYLFDDALDL